MSKLGIEWKLGITITMPQICYLCEEEITKFGIESKSICFHSLDGNHDNWDPKNKVPAHIGCHMSFHNKGKKLNLSDEARKQKSERMRGDDNPSKRPEVQKKISKNNAMKRPEVASKVSKALTGRKYGSERNKKAWKIRKERYGPSGGNFSKGWELRREKYGSSGHSEEAYGRK